jgi:hypothetical protein
MAFSVSHDDLTENLVRDLVIAITSNSSRKPFFKNMTQANQYHTQIDRMMKDLAIALRETLAAYSKGLRYTPDELGKISSSLSKVPFRHNTLLDLASPLLVYSIKTIAGQNKIIEEEFKDMLLGIDLNVAYAKESKIGFGITSNLV